MRQRINKYIGFYLSPGSRIVGWIFAVMGFIGTAIILYLFSRSDLEISQLSFEDDALEKGTALNYYLPYLIPGVVFGLFLIIGLIVILVGYLKKQKVIRILMNNDPISATVVRNIQNFHVQVNRMPRREVTFKTTDGSMYEFHFFSEHLASVLREHTSLEIVTNGKKAYPFITFFEEILGDSQNTTVSNRRNETPANSAESSFNDFIESAENFEKAGSIDAAISFYEGALQFKADRTTAQKLVVLYKTTGAKEKAEAMERELKNWRNKV